MNAGWIPVGVALVGDTICDLMTGVIEAVEVVYPINADGKPNFETYEYIRTLKWEDWIKLPVRPWDLSIHSSHMTVRVPTVVVAVNYVKIHKKHFDGSPTKEGLAIRDNLIDPYTGKELDFEEATIDHVVPRFLGGTDTYDNTVLTTKEINNRKGHKTVEEAGLTMKFKPSQPKPVPVSHTIQKARHNDWRHFLLTNKKKK